MVSRTRIIERGIMEQFMYLWISFFFVNNFKQIVSSIRSNSLSRARLASFWSWIRESQLPEFRVPSFIWILTEKIREKRIQYSSSKIYCHALGPPSRIINLNFYWFWDREPIIPYIVIEKVDFSRFSNMTNVGQVVDLNPSRSKKKK